MLDANTLLAWGATYNKKAANEIIFKEGTTASFYYELISGRVRWVNIDDNGMEFIQTMIEPGECFGELPLFDEASYAATAIADEDCVILRLHTFSFQQMIKENPEIHFTFSKLISQRLRFRLLLAKELANPNPEHRIFTLFNYLKESKKNICSECSKVNLTRQQIANMTGLRVETVIRTIRNLHEKGQLLIDKGKVYY